MRLQTGGATAEKRAYKFAKNRLGTVSTAGRGAMSAAVAVLASRSCYTPAMLCLGALVLCVCFCAAQARPEEARRGEGHVRTHARTTISSRPYVIRLVTVRYAFPLRAS
jgi:hypothetical protein